MNTSEPGPARPTGVSLRVDYPDRELHRWSSALRPIVALPVLLLLALLGSGGGPTGPGTAVAGGGLLVVPTVAMLVVRRRYPRWWFDFNCELVRFAARVCAYLALMDDRYPSTEDEQAVHVAIAYPDARRDLNRWLPLVKWLLVLPHLLVLAVLWLGGVLAVVWAWGHIVAGRRYPRGAFEYLVGVANWHLRVTAYAFLLVSDAYPPFRLHPERRTTIQAV